MDIEQQLSKMTKSQKDFIGVFGNQWAPRKTKNYTGTCERCVWGSGPHSSECVALPDYYHTHVGNWPHSSGCD